MTLTNAAILTKPLQWAAAGLLGVATTWWVVEHVGGPTGTAVVHVCEPGVDLAVGDRTYRVEQRTDAPLVCELPPGRHELRMSRGDRVLYREVFTLGRGEQLVLVAWVPH
jgi:hypothetical protein